MKLECFKTVDHPPELVPANPARAWMDNWNDKGPSRCLPLSAVNSIGWELLCPTSVTIKWNGGNECDDLSISSPEGDPWFVQSHFTRGVVTFHTGYLFRTSPGWNTMASGPPNQFKPNITAMAGLIETDWAPFTFTMNWQMTQPGLVTFEQGEPFCFLTPVEVDSLLQTTPEIKSFEADKEFHNEYLAWKASREEFHNKIDQREPDAMKQGWQKHYMQGKDMSGKTAATHRSKIRMRKPTSL